VDHTYVYHKQLKVNFTSAKIIFFDNICNLLDEVQIFRFDIIDGICVTVCFGIIAGGNVCGNGIVISDSTVMVSFGVLDKLINISATADLLFFLHFQLNVSISFN
jgi:hypothetical protein